MNKHLFLTSLIALSLVVNQANTYQAIAADNSNLETCQKIVIEQQALKKKLQTIVKEPFDININASNIEINVHKVILTSEKYLKNKLYSISSLITKSYPAKNKIITIWKDLNSNYEYKASISGEELGLYKEGRITYKKLFSMIQIEKSRMKNLTNTLEDNLEEPTNYQYKQQKELTKDVENQSTLFQPTKPIYPKENYYTPILKPIIKNDFYVSAQDNNVTVHIIARPPEDMQALKNVAYQILHKIMSKNSSLNKIQINWQEIECGYGKSASLAGIYIKDYFKKRITKGELKEVLFIATIEPTSRRLNPVMAVPRIDVPIENIRKSKDLREAANIYRSNKKYDSAIRTFKHSIKMNPNDYISYYWLGEIYKEKKEFAQAREYFNKSLGLNPDFRRADESLAKIKHK